MPLNPWPVDGAINSALNPYTNWYFPRLHDLLPEPFFHTQAFLIFFAAVFCVYWLIPRRWQMTRIWLLVIASFHFYAAWSYGLAFLVTRPRSPTTSSAGAWARPIASGCASR